MKLQTSRQILEYLRNHPPASAAQIARALLLSKSDSRYHLNHLYQSGAVDRVVKHLHTAAGRPCHYYTALPEGTPSPYQSLARALIASFLIHPDPEERGRRIMQTAEKLAAIFHSDSESGIESILGAVQSLNAIGYKANWEARSSNPVIQLRHCPYLDLALEFPALCELDLRLITHLTGYPCNSQQFMRDDPRNIHFCQFQLLVNP